MREKQAEILRKLPYKEDIKVVYRREDKGLEIITGLLKANNSDLPGYLKWVVYKYPQHPGVIDIGISPTLGCSGRCKMCLSGKKRPFVRKYTKAEIVSQMLHGLDSVQADGYLDRNNFISVDWTCEGEFTDNVDNSCEAIEEMMDAVGLNFKFIITTIGKVKGLRRFVEKWSHLPIDFYWSLHVADRQKREWLIPGSIGQPMEETREILSEYARLKNKRITAATSLAKKFNDTPVAIDAWVKFLEGRPFDTKVQIMTDYCLPDFPEKVTEEEAKDVVDIIDKRGVPSRLRDIIGSKTLGGCGRTVPDFDYFIVSTKAYQALAEDDDRED